MLSDDDNKIKVFASDDNLKSLGELLSNETSRKIIVQLMKHEMYTNEIATKLDIRVSLVIHHLKKLEELGLLEIINKKIKRKGEKHRFFKMNSDIFVTLDKSKDDIKKKDILKRIFKEGIKFTVLGFVSMVSFVFSGGLAKSELRGGVLPPLSEISSLTYAMIVITIGVLVLYFMKCKRKW